MVITEYRFEPLDTNSATPSPYTVGLDFVDNEPISLCNRL